MFEKVRQVYRLLKGQYTDVYEITESYDDISEERVRNELDELVTEGYLERLTDRYYVISSFESQQQEKEAARAIYSVGSRLHSDADTRKEVEVSGTLVEDKSFKTDKSLDEILR